MKNLILVLLFASTAITSSAQSQVANNDKQKQEDIGTTAYGLPVHKSYVAPDVVERAKKKYGRALYSIEKSTAANCEQSYLVGLISKGKLTMEWMCDDPKLAKQRNQLLLRNLLVPGVHP